MQEVASLLDCVKSGDLGQVCDLLNQSYSQFELNAALCWAARLGHAHILSVLLHCGADPQSRCWAGISPLLWAAIFSPDVNTITVLVEHGCDVNHQSTKHRQTALHAAAIRGRHDLVSVLLEAGADPDVVDHLHKTALLHAVQRAHVACVNILLQHNADVEIAGLVDGQLVTPLIAALLQNDLEVTKPLILAGARFEPACFCHTYTVSQYYETVEKSLKLEVRPAHLQQQCRVCLRHILKPRFLAKLNTLPLPKPLKDYIAMLNLDL